MHGRYYASMIPMCSRTSAACLTTDCTPGIHQAHKAQHTTHNTRTPPQDALIREFTNYLGILKAVHSGADLQASAAAVGSSLPQGARGYLGYVTSHIGDSQVGACVGVCHKENPEKTLAGARGKLPFFFSLGACLRG